MQRRAVAVYVALFLLVGTATGALIATADTPEIAFEDPDHELSQGDTFEVDGQEYTVTDISEVEEESHGEVTTHLVAEIEWEQVVEQSETWSNDSVVTVGDRDWRVVIDGEDPTEFTLREEIDRQAILEDDPNADNETVESDGEEYVIVTDEDGNDELVPVDEYFPAPEERTYAEGDTLEYNDQTVTVDAVTTDGATVVWEAPETSSVEVTEEGEITLGDTDYIGIFPSSDELVLSSDFESYEAQLAEIDQYNEWSSGLWRVLIVSGLSALLVVGAAFIPSRY